MTRFLTLILLSFILAPAILVPSAQAKEFNDDQKAEIKKLFEEYLLDNGETVIKSIESYQEEQEAKSRREAEKNAESFLDELKLHENLPATGNEKGDITLVEFFDYNCGYCKKALEELVVVLEKDKNVKVIFLDMPILSPGSIEAAKWSLAANNQGKYFEYHQAILNHRGQKNEKLFVKIAENLDLDLKKLRKDAESEDINKMIQQNLAWAQSLNIRGTPGFVINGKIFPGYIPADRILDIIEAIREG